MNIKAIFLVLSVLVGRNADAQEYVRATQIVSGTGPLKCEAYIHGVETAQKLPIILVLAGTGIYSTGDIVEHNSILKTLIDQKKAVAVTIDKPGITYSADSPDRFEINDSVYNRYTQLDLVSCAVNALKWASGTRYSTVSSDIYLLGQSEGTQVETRLYKKILSDQSMSTRIKAIYTVGLVMQPWKDIINQQITDPAENAHFWKAYADQDDLTLRSYGDLAYAYWADILSTEANIDTLQGLATEQPLAYLEVYHGLYDMNTPVKPVMEFEAWNNKNVESKRPSWNLRARYYNANHGLNLGAINDITNELIVQLNR